MDIIHEHVERMNVSVLVHYPDHEPRGTDPHKKIFDAARKKLKQEGKLICWVCGTDKEIELHHTFVEEAMKNGVDWELFASHHPELNVENEEAFLDAVEGEGNLTPLCQFHHRGVGGIHFIPYPIWIGQQFWKKDLPVPGVVNRQVNEGSSK